MAPPVAADDVQVVVVEDPLDVVVKAVVEVALQLNLPNHHLLELDS